MSLDPYPLRLAVDMSDLDRGIIRALQVDGRRPYAGIARDLGVAEKTVRRRVQELREGGIIDITTVADPEVLGYGAMALLGVHLDGARSASEVAGDVAQVGTVDYVVITTGRYDLLVEVLCPDSSGLLRTVEGEVSTVRGVRECEIFPFLQLHYQEPRWDAARQKSAGEGVGRLPVLDEIDRRILGELNADGRAPFQQVAQRLSVSESQVRQRVTRMVSSGAVRIMAITNPSSLGFRTIAWLGICAAPGVRIEELARRISSLAAIAYLAVTAGRFDILAEAICVDQEDLLRLLDQEVRPLPGVARVEAFLHLNLYYKRVRPLSIPGRDGFLSLDREKSTV
jgi:Lrp/AsnC family transcriptional regulator for asnA, asnC and gidA